MQFAKTIKENGGLRKGGGGDFVRSFPPGETEIRFLLPVEQWTVYNEHYIEKVGVPCTREPECFGCNMDDPEESKTKESLVALVWNLEYEKVDAFRIAKSVYNTAKARQDRRGTILDRNAFVDKSGEGLKTAYQLDWADPSRFDTEHALESAPDINGLLETKYNEVASGTFGKDTVGDDDKSDKSEKPAGEVFEEKELRAMAKSELVVVAEENDIKVPRNATKRQLLVAILDED